MAKKARVKVVWRRGAFRALRTSPEVMGEIDSRAQRIARAAGPGYEASAARATGGRGRARASVRTATTQARRRESRDHTLLKALDAGRG